MSLEQKTALVTGGAVRLGRALVLALAEQGVKVVVHYHSSAAPAEQTVAEVRATGAYAMAVQSDLSEISQASALIERAAGQYGHLDILVNSAAVFEPADLAHTTQALWRRHFAINLEAPFFLSQAFAAQLAEGRKGHIVNIADWRGARPEAQYLAYSLTKAGILAMTKGLALALAPNIQVNAIAPGAILPPPGEDQAYLERLAGEIPLRRTGSPEAIARTLIYLLKSDFVTGETIFVTGGQHLT